MKSKFQTLRIHYNSHINFKSEKAYHFSLKIIKECMEELTREVEQISSLEAQAQNLLKSTLMSSIIENVDTFRPNISTQNTVGTNFMSSIDQGLLQIIFSINKRL